MTVIVTIYALANDLENSQQDVDRTIGAVEGADRMEQHHDRDRIDGWIRAIEKASFDHERRIGIEQAYEMMKDARLEDHDREKFSRRLEVQEGKLRK